MRPCARRGAGARQPASARARFRRRASETCPRGRARKRRRTRDRRRHRRTTLSARACGFRAGHEGPSRRKGPGLDDAWCSRTPRGVRGFRVAERLRPGARAAVDALTGGRCCRRGRERRHERESRRRGGATRVSRHGARQTRRQARTVSRASRAGRARRRRRRRRQRCAVLAGADVAIAVGRRPISRRRPAISCSPGALDALAERGALRARPSSILRQNRRWALCYNFLAVPLAALGFVPPWLAAIGMSASSLAVVLNAMRIGRSEEHARTWRVKPTSARVALA